MISISTHMIPMSERIRSLQRNLTELIDGADTRSADQQEALETHFLDDYRTAVQQMLGSNAHPQPKENAMTQPRLPRHPQPRRIKKTTGAVVEAKPRYNDPKPEEIAERCAEIRRRGVPIQASEVRVLDGKLVKMKPVRIIE